ncbi:hypothetical protein XELAEV_18041537mg [Xenopus laevis]|uniref:Uncharacterized protein n=1 Tax=Xenopus laevis TaxID=8355 RepID=A0A974H564_XENLA|nr:hypothetical protein XELAEV_18041537mg [Xenopus laevis]
MGLVHRYLIKLQAKLVEEVHMQVSLYLLLQVVIGPLLCHSRWLSTDLGIFEIRDFEDPLAGSYLECIRDKITNYIGFALYDRWMAKDCVKITKWWKLHLKN